MIPTLNEGSRCFIKAKFYDKNENPQIPSALMYRLDCETTGQAIALIGADSTGWVSVTPATVVEITIEATANTIINRSNRVERKVATFKANGDPPESAFTEVQVFDLLNLQGI